MYYKTKHKAREHFCMHCLQSFTTAGILKKTKGWLYCHSWKSSNKNTWQKQDIEIQLYPKTVASAFCYLCWFNAITEKIKTCSPEQNQSYTEAYHIKKMIEEVEDCTKTAKKHFKKTVEDNGRRWETFQANKRTSHLLQNIHRHEKDRKTWVKDHCHITGKYRGSAHQDCNVSYFQLKFLDMKIPVTFCHLQDYDSHFIKQGIGQIAYI